MQMGMTREVGILISDKVDCKIKTITRNKKDYIMVKVLIKENIATTNIIHPILEPITHQISINLKKLTVLTMVVGVLTPVQKWADHSFRKLTRKTVYTTYYVTCTK